MERELLKQRQHEGIEIAKAQSKYKGRKPIPIDWEKFGQLYLEWKLKEITAGFRIICSKAKESLGIAF